MRQIGIVHEMFYDFAQSQNITSRKDQRVDTIFNKFRHCFRIGHYDGFPGYHRLVDLHRRNKIRHFTSAARQADAV